MATQSTTQTDIVERTLVIHAKPKLGLRTPKTASFLGEVSSVYPSELSAIPHSARSPIKGSAEFIKAESYATPITPPSAYTTFLKTATPVSASTAPWNSNSETSSGIVSPMSAASSAGDHGACSCTFQKHSASSPQPATLRHPFTNGRPYSARPDLSRNESSASDRTSSSSVVAAPSTTSSGGQHPWSWTVINARASHSPACPRKEIDVAELARTSKTSVRTKHVREVKEVREVVTRTITYIDSPRISPAPKGKRRKIE